jgi:hypothetical protein
MNPKNALPKRKNTSLTLFRAKFHSVTCDSCSKCGTKEGRWNKRKSMKARLQRSGFKDDKTWVFLPLQTAGVTCILVGSRRIRKNFNFFTPLETSDLNSPQNKVFLGFFDFIGFFQFLLFRFFCLY